MRIGMGIKLTTPQRPAGGGGGGKPQTIWNVADQSPGPPFTLSNGSLTATVAATISQTWSSMRANTPRTSGKLYFEVLMPTVAGSSVMVGCMDASATLGAYPGSDSHGVGITAQGNVYTAGAFQATGTAGNYGNGDVCGVAVDFAGLSVSFYRNGVLSYTMSSFMNIMLGNPTYPAVGANVSDAGAVGTLITKSGQFHFTPPSGYTGWDD